MRCSTSFWVCQRFPRVCFPGGINAQLCDFRHKLRISSYMGLWPSCLHVVYRFTFSLGIFFLAQPSQIIGYLGQISSCAWNKTMFLLKTHKELLWCAAPGTTSLSVLASLNKSCLTLIFLKWNGSLQYLQLSVLSGHSRSLWRSCSLKRIRSLQEGQGMIMNSHFPSWFICKK